MLESTFQHFSGVGETTERALWKSGCVTWDHLIKEDYGLPADTYQRLREGAIESKSKLKELDHRYFRENLKSRLAWRAYRTFKKHSCFLDIETTGLSADCHDVTTVCVYSNGKTKNYTLGINLEELSGELENYRYITTFNGMRFDLPFLSRKLGINFHQLHLDLLYPLRSIGLRGGLKRIEQQLGMTRETSGVTGFDAVRLWHAYKRNHPVNVAGNIVKGKKALELLIRYNEEDTKNLEILADYSFKELEKQARLDF